MVTITTDPIRGHITITTDGDNLGPVLVDLGPVLHLTPWRGAHLTPDDARTLAQALTEWADRTDRPDKTTAGQDDRPQRPRPLRAAPLPPARPQQRPTHEVTEW